MNAERGILVVIGTRPEAVKLAPVVHALRRVHPGSTRVVATAQHRELLDQALRFFDLRPDRDLDVMRPAQELADLSARLLTSLDAAFAAEAPALVLAQGDTTTVLMAALAAFYRGIPFAHVEAGLRAPDPLRPFPEEMNRRLVSRVAALHFAPTEGARANLLAEGVPMATVHVTGNPGIDALAWGRARGEAPTWLPPGKRILFVTLHRRENQGSAVSAVCRAAAQLASRDDVAVVFALHSNPAVRQPVLAALANTPNVHLVEHLDYPRMIGMLEASTLVLTDSGGVQEEAPTLGRPVLVLRTSTERPEGVAAGAALLVGTDTNLIVAEASRLLDDADAYGRMAVARNLYGDGRAADRIAILASKLALEGAAAFSR